MVVLDTEDSRALVDRSSTGGLTECVKTSVTVELCLKVLLLRHLAHEVFRCYVKACPVGEIMVSFLSRPVSLQHLRLPKPCDEHHGDSLR